MVLWLTNKANYALEKVMTKEKDADEEEGVC